jgi:hypothetical protein
MRLNRWWRPGLLCCLLAAGACGSIPTDSLDGEAESDGRVYVDEDWGFQIVIPDPGVWGFTAQKTFQERMSNGLPRTELRITRVPESGSFRPVLLLEPHALARDDTAESFAQTVEQVYRSRYLGYRSGPKQVYTVAGAGVVEWVFTTVRMPQVGDRFMLAVVQDGTKGYLLLGSGLDNQFPLDSYRAMLSSMEFR